MTYNFTSTWRLASPIEAVWERIYDWESWPSWWKGVARTQRLGGPVSSAPLPKPEAQEGMVQWRSPLGYSLTTRMRGTVIDPPSEFAAICSGDLLGTATWRLSAKDGVTTVRFFFDVRTTKWWMNLLSPLLRPLFLWNHDQLMRQGAQGLAGRLGATLIQDQES